MARLFAVSSEGSGGIPTDWRRSLKRPWFEHRLVGRCDDAEAACARIRDAAPDLVLLDTELSNGDCVVACRALSLQTGKGGAPIPVVAVAPRLDDSERAALLRAGAAGYLLKTIDAGSLAIALRGFLGAPMEDESGLGSGEGTFASRRDVLTWVGIGTAVAAVPTKALAGGLGVARAAGQEESPPTELPPLPVRSNGESYLLRMQRELHKALKKPVSDRRWVMVIDTRKCIACHACTIACKAENRLPPGVVYRPVIDEEVGTYPNVKRRFLPRPCMQCDRPPCVPVCPVGATWKREDGIVAIDYKKCIGCRYCIAACPYSARTFDFGEYYTDDTPARQPYEKKTSPEYNGGWDRNNGSPVGNARKCHFCLHRLNVGQLPACVTTCIGHATYFGDANDEGSLISQLIDTNNSVRLKQELGTKPKVHYLV